MSARVHLDRQPDFEHTLFLVTEAAKALAQAAGAGENVNYGDRHQVPSPVRESRQPSPLQ